MKQLKLILVISFCFAYFSVFGQLKTVSVPPIINKGRVSYNTTMRIHQALLRAIGEKHGYAVYDRGDGVEAVLNEHSFQRSGLVGYETIQRLGAATGAKFVLCSEIVYENGRLYLYIQFINVESMRVAQSFELSQPHTQEGINLLCKEVDKQIRSGGDTSAKVVSINGYLTVFPRDLGEFKTPPTTIIEQLNKANAEGYNGWRLPTPEELSMMRAAAYEIPNFPPKPYMTSGVFEYNSPVTVRLVTTEASAASIAESRKQTILKLLGVTNNDGILDMESGLFIANEPKRFYYYGTGVTGSCNVFITQLSNGWQMPSLSQLKTISKYLKDDYYYVYDWTKEYSLGHHSSTHYIFYVYVYNKIYGCKQKESGRWSYYRKSGASSSRSSYPFYVLPVKKIPSETAIQAAMKEMNNK